MTTTISNSKIRADISSNGAELISLKKSKTGKEYIWNGNPEFWAKHSPTLFPIVGTLKNNSYLYNNVEYHLSRHGFARDNFFEIIQQTNNEIVFSLKSNDETLKKYPFQFELQIKYTISENALHVTYNVFNNNDVQMPFSIGGHPAFALEKEFENYSLTFEADETLEYYPLENDLLLNQSSLINLEKKTLPLTYSLFENDALVFKQLKSKNIQIVENNKPIFNFNFNDFPNFGIWTKINAPFICLEPWVGYADTVSANGNILEKEGIILLEPKKNTTFTFSITIL
ncbi:aldose 1-epimerase family protein [Flavobacterium macrobrachii]|uniref:Aldose 1-epimerase family protein n=1 Tax=Flavobacterium macrobrachii TaxID=591204 RepID=A0ABS2CUQ6_9FLAO|nr:aldose 1-epimerase family protein [Flavobacterium macrobrachii]MBM6498660.1 aldose 1-epimerase family protein [Flavobacterium macrobrachii]